MSQILQCFRRIPVITVSTLAAKFQVSERTIRNDIKQLNQELGGIASIEGNKGQYGLHIFSAEEFNKVFAKLSETDAFLNSPKNRMDYAFGRLVRSATPILTDQLAYEMNVGRSTLIGDLKKLREEVSEYGLAIEGKTSKGLVLHGEEINIRKYILEKNYQYIYKDYPLDREIVEVITTTFHNYSIERSVQQRFEQFVTLMLDRFLTGHYIGKLNSEHYRLGARDEFEIVNILVDNIGNLLDVEIPLEEKIFVFLPILGMRTPADITKLGPIKLDSNIPVLMENIIASIRQEMNINLVSNEFTQEFLYHLMFMCNRLKYGIKIQNPLLEDLQQKYPLAYQMAGVAARIVERDYGLQVSESEKGYLAAYFGVFLTENTVSRKQFKIALVCGTGRVTARLVAIQLKKILDSSTILDTYSDENITQEIMSEYDIVITTVPLSISCHRPVIRINEVFDEQEIRYKIEKAKYWDKIDLPILDNNWFVMSGFLDKNRFFLLDDNQTYEQAVDYMVDKLTVSGYLDEEFKERIHIREAKGTMIFGHSIAIPHSIQFVSDKLVLAVGVSQQPICCNAHKVQVIFLLGVPQEFDSDDSILIRVYDEIISLARNEEMLKKIASAKNFQELLGALYKRAGNN